MKKNIPLSKESRCFLASLAAALILAILFQLFACVRYETGDDFMIAGIPAGISGARDYHTVYVNDLLGRLFMGLNTVAPAVPWYGLFQYGLILASLTALIYLILKKKNAFSLILVTALLSFFGYEYLVKVQYTKSGALAGIAGLFLLVDAIEKEKLCKKELCAGITLFLLGSFYRFAMFLGALGILAVFGISRLILTFRSNRTAFKRYLIIIPAVFIAGFLLYSLHNLDYRTDEWKAYRTFLDDERELNDYGYPSYSKNKDVYEALDINKNALEVYYRLDISDPGKYTDDVVNTISAAKKPKKVTFKRIGEFFSEVVSQWFINYPYVFAALAAVVLSILLKKRSYIILLLTGVMILVIQFILYILGRVGFNRVDTGIFLALFMTAAFLAGEKETEWNRKKLILSGAVSVSLILLSVVLYHNLTPYQNSIDIEPEMLAEKEYKLSLYDEMEKDKSSLYFCSNSAYDYIGLFTPLEPILPESVTNTIRMGSWLTYSPPEYALWEKNGVENPYKTLAWRSDALLMTYDVYVESMVKYLNDYYNPEPDAGPYHAALVKDIGGKKLYRLYKVETLPDFDPEDILDRENRLETVYEMKEENGVLSVSGSAFLEGENSFQSRYYLVLTDEKDAAKTTVCLTQSENPYASDLLHGQYSCFDGAVRTEGKLKDCRAYLVYENGNGTVLSKELTR